MPSNPLQRVAEFLTTAMALLFGAGPRGAGDTGTRPPALPPDLDRYLAGQEGRFRDIVPGAEKKIIWAGPPGVRTDRAVVYIHGFSGTRQETAPLADMVARGLGANLFYTRLTGHGRTGPAMLDGSVNAWLNDTVEAFEIGRRLGRRVVMLGVSTGGTAVTWLAAQPETGDLAACILISPNFAPANRAAQLLTWPWGKHLAELLIGPERRWEAENPGHDHYWTNQYPTAAMLPMMGMVRLVGSLDLSRVQAPVLVIYSPQDRIVSPRAAVKVFAALGSPRKILRPFTGSQDPSQHILAGDVLSPGTTAEVADMILEFLRPPP